MSGLLPLKMHRMNSHLTRASDWVVADVRSVITDVLKMPSDVRLMI
jgi:hypothetical protein